MIFERFLPESVYYFPSSLYVYYIYISVCFFLNDFKRNLTINAFIFLFFFLLDCLPQSNLISLNKFFLNEMSDYFYFIMTYIGFEKFHFKTVKFF